MHATPVATFLDGLELHILRPQGRWATSGWGEHGTKGARGHNSQCANRQLTRGSTSSCRCPMACERDDEALSTHTTWNTDDFKKIRATAIGAASARHLRAIWGLLDCSAARMVGCLAGFWLRWLVGRSVGRSMGWLVGRLACWLVDRCVCFLACLLDCLPVARWLIYFFLSFVRCFVGNNAGWPTDRLAGLFVRLSARPPVRALLHPISEELLTPLDSACAAGASLMVVGHQTPSKMNPTTSAWKRNRPTQSSAAPTPSGGLTSKCRGKFWPWTAT